MLWPISTLKMKNIFQARVEGCFASLLVARENKT